MPLNLQTNDGDFTPYIKYNAKAGRWYIKVEGQDGEAEVVNPTLAFDFDNIKTGWLFFMEGVGPEKIWDPSRETPAPKPPGSKAFKRGFEVIVYGSGNIGLREFASTAGAMVSALLQMYTEYENGIGANLGKVPVFQCTGVKPITGKHGTNYSPLFTLKKWTERAVFDNAEKAPPVPQRGHTGWTLTQAVQACEAAGVTKQDLGAEIQKTTGQKKWNAVRDTPTVQALIARKQAESNGQEEDMDFDELAGAPPAYDDQEIPFSCHKF